MTKVLPQFTLQRQPTGISAVAFVEGPKARSQYLVTADRHGTLKLWDLDVREVIFSTTDASVRDLDRVQQSTDSPLSSSTGSSGLSGILSVQDATPVLAEDERRLFDGSGVVYLLVQLRSQRLLLLRWTFVDNFLESARVLLAWDVEQFGFCAASLARLRGSDGAYSKRGPDVPGASLQGFRYVAALAIPAEVHADGTTSVTLHAIAASQVDTDASTEVVSSEIWCRLMVGEAPIKYGQLMCLSLEPVSRAWGSKATKATSTCQDFLLLTMSTESGHVGFALLCLSPSAPQGSKKIFLPNHALLRASAEPSTFCRAVSLSYVRSPAHQEGAAPPQPQPCVSIACCTAEGRVQLFRVQPSSDEIGLASDDRPTWTMLWEYHSRSGLSCCDRLGRLETEDDNDDGGAISALAVGGWDSSVAILDTSCGALVTSLEYHGKAVSSLASRLVAAGPLAASGSQNIERFSAAPRRASYLRRNDGGYHGSQRGEGSVSWTVFSASEDGGVAAWLVDLRVAA